MRSVKEARWVELAFDLWTEAAEEHVAGKPAECGACWKSYMASELWRHATDVEVPINYYQSHQAAQFRLRNLNQRKLRLVA